eukprot:g17956.t1
MYQLAPVVQELGGVVWNFEARGQLGRWVGRTNSTQSDLLNSSSLFTPDELRLPQQGIALLQSPRFYFLNLSVPVLPPTHWGSGGAPVGLFRALCHLLCPRTPPRRTSRRAAPHPTLGSFTDIRLDDAALLALLKNYSTAPLTLDFIATVPQIELQVRAVTANSNFLEFINYWDDSNWTACQAACGEEGVQTMQAPQCRAGGTGEPLSPAACQPSLTTAQSRACRVADCASVPDCVQLNGTCWYLGELRESCLDVCTREGLVYDDFHTVSIVGSGASSAADCQNVLNHLLNASAVRWQEWDIPKEFFHKLDFNRLESFVTPYYLQSFVPFPDDVAATYGVGCIISNNTNIFGHNHPWRDTSPTLGYSRAYNVQRVCACQPNNFHWAEHAMTPCNQTCQKGYRTGTYECLDISGQRANLNLSCPNATSNTPSPVPCASDGCVWVTQPYQECELPGLAARSVQCVDPATGRIQADEECDPTLQPETADLCDFNECFTQTDDCDANANCTNTDGLYSGNGVTCVARTLSVSIAPVPPTGNPRLDAMGNLLVPEGGALQVTVNISELNTKGETLIDIVAFVRIPRVSPDPPENFTLSFPPARDMSLPTAFSIPANTSNVTFQLISPNTSKLEPLCIYLVEVTVSNPTFFSGSGFVSLQDNFACTVFNVSALNYTINLKKVLRNFSNNSLALETLVSWQKNSNDTKTVGYQVTRRRCLFPTEIIPQPKNIIGLNQFLVTAAVPAPTTSPYVFTGSNLLTLLQPQTVVFEAAVPNATQAYPILVSIRLQFPTAAPNLRLSPMCLTASNFTDECLWQTDRAFTDYQVGDWTQLTAEFHASDIDFSSGHPTVAFVVELKTGAPKLQVYLAGFQVVSYCQSDVSQDITPTQVTYGDALMKVEVAGALVQAHYAFAVLAFNLALQSGHLSLFSYPRPTECVIGNHCPLSGRCVASELLKDSTLLPDEYGCAVPQCRDGMRNGNETSIDCGDLNSLVANYSSSCPTCTENFDRCQSHKDCSGKLCLRQRSPLPTLPCFAQLLLGGATTTYRIGTSSAVSGDVSKALWLVRGDPNCELIVYSPSAKANTSWTQGNYTAGQSYPVSGGTFRSFPTDVSEVFVRLYICYNYTDRDACNADRANACKFCNATSKCYHNVAGQTPCPGDPWADPLAQDSQEYFIGYNLQQGDEDLGYCIGPYTRRVEVLLPSKTQGCPDSCSVSTEKSCGSGLNQGQCESRGCCYASGQCFFSSARTPSVSLVCQCEQKALITIGQSPLYPIPKGALEAPSQQFLLSFQDLDDNTATATHEIFLYGPNSTASNLLIAATLHISTQSGQRLISLVSPASGLNSTVLFDIIDGLTQVVITVQAGTLYISKHTDLTGALTAKVDGFILFVRIASADVTWWELDFCLAVLICDNDGVCTATITAAVNLANQDDVIVVSQGISSSTVNIQRAGLTILGGWDSDFYARFTITESASDTTPALLANTFACSFIASNETYMPSPAASLIVNESVSASLSVSVSPTPSPALNSYPITVETFSYETLLKNGQACGLANNIPALSRVRNTFLVEFRLQKSALMGWELVLPTMNIFVLESIVLTDLDGSADTSIITSGGTRLYVNCEPARRYRITFSFFSPVQLQQASSDLPQVNMRVLSGRTAGVVSSGWQLFDASVFFMQVVDPFNSDLVIADTYSEFDGGVIVYKIDNDQVAFSGVNTGQLTILTGGNIKFTEFQVGSIQINDAYPALGNGVVTGRITANYSGSFDSKVNIIGYMYILDTDTHECFIIYRNTGTSPVKESADCTTAFGKEDQYTFLSPGFEPMPRTVQGSVLVDYRSITTAWTPPDLADVTEYRLFRDGDGLISQRGATFQDQDPLTFKPGVPVLYCVDAYFNLQQQETDVVYSIIYSSRQVCVLVNFPWLATFTGTVQKAPLSGESAGSATRFISNSLVCALPKSAQLILADDNLAMCYEEAASTQTRASRACCTYTNALGQFTINARHTQLKGVTSDNTDNVLVMATIAEDDEGAAMASVNSNELTMRYTQILQANVGSSRSVLQVENITTPAIVTVTGFVLYPDTCALTDFTVTVVLKSGTESVAGTTFPDGSYTITWNLGFPTDTSKLVFTSSNLIKLQNKGPSQVGTVRNNMLDVSALAAGTYQLDLTDVTMIQDYRQGDTVTGLVKATECDPGGNIGIWDVDIYSCGGLYSTVSVGFSSVDLSPPAALLSPHNYTYTFVVRSYQSVPANVTLGYIQAAQVFFQQNKNTLQIFPLLQSYSETQLPANALLQSFVYTVQPIVKSQTAVGTCGPLLPAGFDPTACREPGVIYRRSSLCLQDGPRPGLDIVSQSQVGNGTLCHYTLLLQAYEDHQKYGGPSTRCDEVWATVNIRDYVSTPDPGAFVTNTTLMNYGEAQYNFTVQGPSLVCPLTRQIEFDLLYEQKPPPTASSGNTSSRGARSGLVYQGIQLMIVNGSKQRAPLFISESDGYLPWLILRDPPGDMSFCKWSTASDLSFTITMTADKATAYKGNAKILVNFNLGTSAGWWAAYFGTTTVAFEKESLALTYSSDGSVSHSSSFNVKTQLGRSFATHKGGGMPPPLGDLMIGGAVAFQYTLVAFQYTLVAFQYTLVDNVLVDLKACSVARSVTGAWDKPVANQNAMYVYTHWEVLNILRRLQGLIAQGNLDNADKPGYGQTTAQLQDAYDGWVYVLRYKWLLSKQLTTSSPRMFTKHAQDVLNAMTDTINSDWTGLRGDPSSILNNLAFTPVLKSDIIAAGWSIAFGVTPFVLALALNFGGLTEYAVTSVFQASMASQSWKGADAPEQRAFISNFEADVKEVVGEDWTKEATLWDTPDTPAFWHWKPNSASKNYQDRNIGNKVYDVLEGDPNNLQVKWKGKVNRAAGTGSQLNTRSYVWSGGDSGTEFTMSVGTVSTADTASKVAGSFGVEFGAEPAQGQAPDLVAAAQQPPQPPQDGNNANDDGYNADVEDISNRRRTADIDIEIADRAHDRLASKLGFEAKAQAEVQHSGHQARRKMTTNYFQISAAKFSAGFGLTSSNSASQRQAESEGKSQTVLIHLEDKDKNDRFWMEIYEDPVYATPIFKVQASDTQCPCEAMTSQYIGAFAAVPDTEGGRCTLGTAALPCVGSSCCPGKELTEIAWNNQLTTCVQEFEFTVQGESTLLNIAPDADAIFTLVATSTPPTQRIQETYTLTLASGGATANQANLNGLEVRWDGLLVRDYIIDRMNLNEPRLVELRLTRLDQSQYEFGFSPGFPIAASMFPGCDEYFRRKTVLLQAQWQRTAPYIHLSTTQPVLTWTPATTSLTLLVVGFQFPSPSLSPDGSWFNTGSDKVILQYRLLGELQWWDLNLFNQANNLLTYSFGPAPFYEVNVLYELGADVTDPLAAQCVTNPPARCLNEGTYELRVLTSLAKFAASEQRPDFYPQLRVSTRSLILLEPSSPADNQQGVILPASKIMHINYIFNLNLACGHFRLAPTVTIYFNSPVTLPDQSNPYNPNNPNFYCGSNTVLVSIDWNPLKVAPYTGLRIKVTYKDEVWAENLISSYQLPDLTFYMA